MFSKVKAGAAGAGLTPLIVALIVAGLKAADIEVGAVAIGWITAAVAALLSMGGGWLKLEKVGRYR